MVVLSLLVFVEPMGLEILDARTEGRIIAGWYEFGTRIRSRRRGPNRRLPATIPSAPAISSSRKWRPTDPFRYVGYGGVGSRATRTSG